MASVGVAAVQGIESGFSLGLRGAQMRSDEEERRRRAQAQERQQADLDEERAYRRTRDRVTDQRQAALDEQQARKVELEMIDSDLGALKAEGESLFATYGGYDKVPEDVRTDYTKRSRDMRSRRAAVRRAFSTPTVQDQRRAAAEVWARVQAGQMSPDDLSGDELVTTITAQSGRPISDFLARSDGRPSVIRQAVLDVEAGLQAGNQDLLLRGANVLLARELSSGVGTDGPDGSEIVRKTLVALAPHPQDPSKVVPILEVAVRRDDGALGKYRAPVTEGRGVYSTDPGAMPKAIPVQQLVERLGQVGVMEAWINQPQTRQRIEAASPKAKASADEFLQALASVGVTVPKAKAVEFKAISPGQELVGIDAQGREVSRIKGPPPRGAATAGGRGLGLAPPTAAPSEPDAERTTLATRLGVPVADRDPFAGMSEKSADVFRRSLYQQADKKLNDLDEAVSSARDMAQDVQRFLELQQEAGMQGPVAGRTWAMSSEAQEMDAISDRITPQMRQPGSGATSDFDAKMFRNSTVSRTKNEDANKAIGQAVVLRAQNMADRAQFMRDYLSVNGHLDGADRQWKRYLDANPIFDPESKEAPKLNAARVPYQRFFGGRSATEGQGGATVRLPSDAKAAAEAYGRLPSGTVFIDPNGVQRRKP